MVHITFDINGYSSSFSPPVDLLDATSLVKVKDAEGNILYIIIIYIKYSKHMLNSFCYLFSVIISH